MEIIFVMWDENVFKFCLMDCLLLILVNICLKIVIVEFFCVGIWSLDCVMSVSNFNVFRVIVLLFVFGLVIMMVVKFLFK